MLYDIFYNWHGANAELFVYLNNLLNTETGYLPYLLARLTHLSSIYSFAVMYISLCIFYYINTITHQYKEEEFHDLIIWMLKFGCTYALFIAIFTTLKHTINLPRPLCSLDETLFSTLIYKINIRCLSSFPSAHTGIALIINYYFWSSWSARGKLFGLIFILIAILARISLAMHYPADILYSAIITTLIITINNFIWSLIPRSFTGKVVKPIFAHQLKSRQNIPPEFRRETRK